MGDKKIAIIPARAGSKGLIHKNIAELCGKPLLAYTIQAAADSRLFEDVIVSTDSGAYGRIAQQYGAGVMYRDEALAADDTPSYAVIEDVLKRYEEDVDFFVLLQPTSPLRDAGHIVQAVSLFEANADRFDFLVSVKEAEQASALIRPLGADGSMQYFDQDFSSYARQKYREYSPNGAIFIGKKKAYMKQRHFFGSRAMAYVMNREDSVDIDTEFDLDVARLYMERKRKKTGR